MKWLIWFLGLQNWFAGGVWKSWGMNASSAPEFCSCGLEDQTLKEEKTVKTVLVIVVLKKTQGEQESSRELG